MENPYDTAARSLTSSATGDEYRWDVAYFDGHYYVYVGIVPLLIMYLPFRAIFDAPFPSAIGIMIFAMLFTIVKPVLDTAHRRSQEALQTFHPQPVAADTCEDTPQ